MNRDPNARPFRSAFSLIASHLWDGIVRWTGLLRDHKTSQKFAIDFVALLNLLSKEHGDEPSHTKAKDALFNVQDCVRASLLKYPNKFTEQRQSPHPIGSIKPPMPPLVPVSVGTRIYRLCLSENQFKV
ncbi:hypothetical protein NL676_014528 [Syzygium grande]|nr:hypothetical protein NL676_014528 [Syzygium grande]